MHQPNLGIGHTSLLKFVDHAQVMVWLLWTGDQLIADTTMYKTHKKEIHTDALDHTATEISLLWITALVSLQ